MDFESLGLSAPVLKAVSEKGYTTPTPIQEKAIPIVLMGRDVLGCAQTGTGKTASFVLPMIDILAEGRGKMRMPRSLILEPTRELAAQVAENFDIYGKYNKLSMALLIGGVSFDDQERALEKGVDVLIATPGRLLDLIARGRLRLDSVSHLVLDEADRMLDMGFVRDVRKIVAMMPKARQSLLFSATMPQEIARLAAELLRSPVRVEVSPPTRTAERIDQRVFMVEAGAKRTFLANLLADPAMARVIVFTRTKHGADRVAEHLGRAGIAADAIHGNKSQNARERALERFRAGNARVLVATDIAARGIDVTDITHVVNYEIPNIAESYVHRIGRTARAGAAGVAISLCDPSERGFMRDIEKLTAVRLLDDGADPIQTAPSPARRGGKAAPSARRNRRWSRPQHQRRRAA